MTINTDRDTPRRRPTGVPQMPGGCLVISLDFELYWGVMESRSLESYRENLAGVENAVNELLKLFGTHRISATWAVVGMLCCADREHLLALMPGRIPRYENQALSTWRYTENHPDLTAPCHFAPELVEAIGKQEGQEIATHTFSHYYCLEEGQDKESFRDDLALAVEQAGRLGYATHSIVYPRNQVNPAYHEVLAEMGIRAWRGNQRHWIFAPGFGKKSQPVRRALVLLDNYVNLTGANSAEFGELDEHGLLNMRASRFLRPVSSRLQSLEWLRLRRIKSEMTSAAKRGKVYHLWWHPHNFGVRTEENLKFLEELLQHYRQLCGKYGMRSCNMGDLAAEHFRTA